MFTGWAPPEVRVRGVAERTGLLYSLPVTRFRRGRQRLNVFTGTANLRHLQSVD